ncbi:hypothetical protein MKX08_007256 [Trichoderma sp. CBMAI-0020]|nr:hypothetical protein MKX08_007256 [Trichoderma sp. CBMAI-0020]
MTKIWKDEIPPIAFQHPYLMHTMLAVPTAFRRTQHDAMSRLVAAPDQDTRWATSALLGPIAVASFEEMSLENAWLVRSVHAFNLEWMRLTVGKRII